MTAAMAAVLPPKAHRKDGRPGILRSSRIVRSRQSASDGGSELDFFRVQRLYEANLLQVIEKP